VYSAYFYLGIMHMEGLYPVKTSDPLRAMQLYIKGAAKNNAFCYFELARIYGEG
jgi:TPR repeat protein